MNFLSHYYFDRTSTDCYHILGTALPDLLKNADKSIILHPEKLVHTDSRINSLIAGWSRHLEVDRHYHCSEFFEHHSRAIKLQLLPAIEGSPVKPFFLGHVAIELILDNLLLTTGKISVDEFYKHLNNCDEEVIREFLEFSGLHNTDVFLTFFEGFKKHRYLETYTETAQVAYALKRICMRIWHHPFTAEQEASMNEVIAQYRLELLDNFMGIFEQIEEKL
ncbi:hypothetical protein C8P68_106157 [Mucilaginibacter yixingensis]|uniref:Acyl carrier protein phosphodiesterase n=1 Tax=Mucilaginibacter yixingensis TaxID=1295612 RepID=A0A2T5J717_9SPHI|nr:hypothetical protein [Mucilaginibacter yixingensis]PTQ94943.1 hypothetical protein C8P68_106157 [Mucilaginibacter yixingensis]